MMSRSTSGPRLMKFTGLVSTLSFLYYNIFANTLLDPTGHLVLVPILTVQNGLLYMPGNIHQTSIDDHRFPEPTLEHVCGHLLQLTPIQLYLKELPPYKPISRDRDVHF